VEIRTLIVDDQPDVRLLMRLVIETANRGLVVSGEAAGGEEALDRLEEDDPTVIVLDQMMPDMNGLQTAARIRALRPEQVIVLCSAYLDADLVAEARAVGVDWCVGKEHVGRLPDLIRDAHRAAS
jgi:DNA-binding NarL/FixJ family response regulator